MKSIEIPFHEFKDIGDFEDFACEMLDDFIESQTEENGGLIPMTEDEMELYDNESTHFFSTKVMRQYEALQGVLIDAAIAHYELTAEEITYLEIKSDLIKEL